MGSSPSVLLLQVSEARPGSTALSLLFLAQMACLCILLGSHCVSGQDSTAPIPFLAYCVPGSLESLAVNYSAHLSALETYSDTAVWIHLESFHLKWRGDITAAV